MPQSRMGSMVSERWIRETREYFLEFLRATNFPEFSEQGERGPEVEYPEWLIMLIGVVAVKSKEKTYVGIHRLSTRYWKELCGKEVRTAPISPLAGTLKKNLLCAWNRCRIHGSNFSCGILAMRSSVPTR
jgi:hypothetical protein